MMSFDVKCCRHSASPAAMPCWKMRTQLPVGMERGQLMKRQNQLMTEQYYYCC